MLVFRINMKNNRYLFHLCFCPIAVLSINVDSLVRSGRESFLQVSSELNPRSFASQRAVSRLQEQSLQAQAGVRRDEGLVKPAGQVDQAQV